LKRPGGCSWRKITFRSRPLNARHTRMRRQAYAASRSPVPDSGAIAPQKRRSASIRARASAWGGLRSPRHRRMDRTAEDATPNMSRKHLPAPAPVSIGCSLASSAAPLDLMVRIMPCRSPAIIVGSTLGASPSADDNRIFFVAAPRRLAGAHRQHRLQLGRQARPRTSWSGCRS
jgi:hypothetical protein